jgi:hypothetical protein
MEIAALDCEKAAHTENPRAARVISRQLLARWLRPSPSREGWFTYDSASMSSSWPEAGRTAHILTESHGRSRLNKSNGRAVTPTHRSRQGCRNPLAVYSPPIRSSALARSGCVISAVALGRLYALPRIQ